MKTIMPIQGELKQKGEKLGEARDEFLTANPYKNPVIWIDYDDGSMIICADGQYNSQLKEFLERLN